MSGNEGKKKEEEMFKKIQQNGKDGKEFFKQLVKLSVLSSEDNPPYIELLVYGDSLFLQVNDVCIDWELKDLKKNEGS